MNVNRAHNRIILTNTVPILHDDLIQKIDKYQYSRHNINPKYLLYVKPEISITNFGKSTQMDQEIE